MFGVTLKSRLGQLIVMSLAVLTLGIVLSMRWGLSGFVPSAVLLVGAIATARSVAVAQSALWRSACLDLKDPAQHPSRLDWDLLPATTLSLLRLAKAVDAVRRAHYAVADEQIARVDRDLLRPEEVHLFDAARAMVSVGLGSLHRGAQQAVGSLPSGSDELDQCLGRTMIADAWHNPVRLMAIQDAWDRAGVTSGPVDRLRRLAQLRLDSDRIEAVSTAEARELSLEARAIGDDELASELDARSRANAYR